MSGDEYEYDDLDDLTALLDVDEDINPYDDDGLGQRSTSGGQRSTQGSTSGVSSQKTPLRQGLSKNSCSSVKGSHGALTQDNGATRGQRSFQGQRSPEECKGPMGDNKNMDEEKSKEQLMAELQMMREQFSLLQQNTGGSGQVNQPRETFSDAISVPVETKRVTKKKATSSSSDEKSGKSRRYSAEEIGALAGTEPMLSNPDDDDDDDDNNEELRPQAEAKSALFGKSSKRVAHTPNNTSKKPDKVSPYKCELCKELLDTRDDLDFHMFQHRKDSPQECHICGMSFHSKLKLEAHARTHKKAPSASSVPSSATVGAKKRTASKSLGAAAGSGCRSSETSKKENLEHVETNKHSQLRILNPLVSSARLDSMMDSRKMLRLSILQRYLDSGPNDGNWVTMGVIVSKLPPKTSSKGKTFSIWKLSDLTVCDQTVTLFLFGKAHDDHWKTGLGSVIGLLNPSVMPPKDNAQDDGVTLSIDHPEKLLLVGTSKDFGHCRGRRKDGKTCSMVVNKAVSEFCQYHVQTEYKKHSSKRADLQSSYGGVQPKAFKKKLGSNIIYGGQTYNPVSASVVGNSLKPKKKEKQVALQSLGVKGAKEIEQEARDSVLTLHGRQNNEDTLVKVSGANKQFKEMLGTPCLGAQNLIRHMVKVEEVSKPISTITPKDLLQQHQRTMQAKKASRVSSQKSAASSSASSSASSFSRTLSKGNKQSNSSADLKLGSKETNAQKDSENCVPILGRGLMEDDDVIFDFSTSPKNLLSNSCGKTGKGFGTEGAKKRAIAMVRSKGPLSKADPNQVGVGSKGSMSPRKREAVKRRVEEDLNRSLEDDSGEDLKQPAKKQKKSFLGQDMDMSQDELKTILNAKSKHSGLLAEVQAEIEEIYFQQLEKKERLENQMASIKEKKCKVVSCKKCDYTWFSPSTLCTSENHPIARHEATMRYFKCKQCQTRSVTFNRIPNKSCSDLHCKFCLGGAPGQNHHRSCGSTSYERTSMLKERKGPVLDSERLLIRGEERKWVM